MLKILETIVFNLDKKVKYNFSTLKQTSDYVIKNPTEVTEKEQAMVLRKELIQLL